MSAAVAAPPRPSTTAGAVLSRDPLIVISKRETSLALGLASLLPERFADRPSLHLIGLTWSYETEASAAQIARDLAQAEQTLPQARFVIMANTPSESVAFARVGVPNVLANELIFVDERLYVPSPPGRRIRLRHDAIYIARLSKSKRHDLATAVENLLLLYGRPESADVERTRALLPKALFANHDLNDGVYKLHDERAVRDFILQSAVGLCLSPVEGAMRASLEYQLCGLPVVSIKSAGGRDRYLLGPHVRIVDEDPGAVAAAVREMKTHAPEPFAVRDYVGALVAFDRHNFLLNLNKIVAKVFGMPDRFPSFKPFVGFPVKWRAIAALDAEFGDDR